MPIISLKDSQKRAHESGRIRLGVKTIGANGKERPQKLSTLRFTSPARHLIDEIGRLYGGDVSPWQAPSGPQWEVITTTNSVPVYVARQLIDPWYEMGGNGYIQRRCDGETEVKRNVPCLCNPDNRDCKPTTRLKVYLADVPGNGVFRLESHGWNFAEELGGDMADWIATLPDGIRLPGLLAVEPRKEKKLVIENGQEKIKTFEYMVPVLYFDQITSRQIAGGPSAYMPVIEAAERQAIGAAATVAPVAIAAAPAPPPPPPVDYVAAANAAKDADTVRRLWRQAGQAGHLTEPLKEHLKARVLDLEPPEPEPDAVEGTDDWAALIDRAADLDALRPLMDRMNQAGAKDPALKQRWWARKRELEHGPTAPVETVVGEREPDKDTVWTAIMLAAGNQGWNTPTLIAKFAAAVGCEVADADGWAMDNFLQNVKSGAIQ